MHYSNGNRINSFEAFLNEKCIKIIRGSELKVLLFVEFSWMNTLFICAISSIEAVLCIVMHCALVQKGAKWILEGPSTIVCLLPCSRVFPKEVFSILRNSESFIFRNSEIYNVQCTKERMNQNIRTGSKYKEHLVTEENRRCPRDELFSTSEKLNYGMASR